MPTLRRVDEETTKRRLVVPLKRMMAVLFLLLFLHHEHVSSEVTVQVLLRMNQSSLCSLFVSGGLDLVTAGKCERVCVCVCVCVTVSVMEFVCMFVCKRDGGCLSVVKRSNEACEPC